ncbi:efflux RND transporter periplasmic adaptor subunit [Acidisoma cellulosilytica]|uniref:Efflux RND transporter periplasmic adaptor subunit n=1 Tax=Acidisoma cellulosilyticum TaxID=2802395 RepID=A0A964E542_9PROT|nr:efflux RND transporter periplasmic adaptor subunit [Acidisoma cellulosilyticum]MCB8882151.1 efflux RND transporter periplasmic adaptor subunit [Acidisoma cellulosilyticum]
MTEAVRPKPDECRARSVAQARAKAPLRWAIAATLFGSATLAYCQAGGSFPLIRTASAQFASTLPSVVVSYPLQHDEDARIAFLGQFSAVNRVELRAQVGGVLSEIHFQDGQIVHQGDLLFVIDPTPYEINLAQAKAQLASAQAKYILAKQELYRAQTLKETTFGTAENVDERTADASLAEAAVEAATATIRDAAFDLQHCNIVAPFTGRIGAHQVSIGSLVAGSRFSTSPTTLLGILVSLDPIYFNFDMSEADYLRFETYRRAQGTKFEGRVMIRLSDETHFLHPGQLDFVNNEIDRSSGTIHARAALPNTDLSLTPGAFGRVRLTVSPPAPALLVPDASVLLDQDQHIVLTVADDGTVVPKTVEIGGMRGGLRMIDSGLTAQDRVIIDGIVRANPGMKVKADPGSIKYDAPDGQQ